MDGRGSLCLDAGLFDHFRPLGDIVPDLQGELSRLVGYRHEAHLHQPRAHIVRVDVFAPQFV